MIYTTGTKKALKLCFEAHKEQVDKSGAPYVFHPFHLAEQMKDERTTIVALLHDVVEDTDYTFDNLRNMGFDVADVNVDYEVNDSVRVMNGPLENFIGVVQEINKEKNKVKVLVSMFGRETPVVLEFSQVKKVQ